MIESWYEHDSSPACEESKEPDGCQFVFGSGSSQGKKKSVGRVGSRGKKSNAANGGKIKVAGKSFDDQSVKIGKRQRENLEEVTYLSNLRSDSSQIAMEVLGEDETNADMEKTNAHLAV